MQKPLLVVGAFLTLFLGLNQPAFSDTQVENSEQPGITESGTESITTLPELSDEEAPQAAADELPVAPEADEASE